MKDPAKLMAIGVGCCIVASICVCLASINAIIVRNGANVWPAVSATVQVVEERNGAGGRSPTPYLYVQYKYNFNGNSFVSDNGGFSGNIPSQFEDEMEHWKPGQIITAYVNPKKPSYAVLSREIGSSIYVVMMLSAFLAMALSYFLFLLTKNAKVKQSIRELFRWQRVTVLSP